MTTKSKFPDHDTMISEAIAAYQSLSLDPDDNDWYVAEKRCACFLGVLGMHRSHERPPAFEDDVKGQRFVKKFVTPNFSKQGDDWLMGVIDGFGGVGPWVTDRSTLFNLEEYTDGHALGKKARERILLPFQRGELVSEKVLDSVKNVA